MAMARTAVGPRMRVVRVLYERHAMWGKCCIRADCRFLLVAALLSSPVYAAEWSVEKNIQFGIVHNNSKDLSEPGTQQTTTVGQVKPTLSLTGRGNKTDVLLLTELDFLKSDFADEQTVVPRLYGTIESTLVDRTLFVDSNLSLDKVVVSSDSAISDSLRLDEESSITASFNVNPRLELELADAADLRVRYGFNAYNASSEALKDSQSNRIDVNVDSKVSRTGYQVGTTATLENTEFSEGDPLRQRSVSLNTSKQWGLNWRLNAAVGREWNEIPDQSNVDMSSLPTMTEQSNTWDLGIRWNSGPRTSLMAGYGGGAFGGRPSLEIVHRSRRSTYSLTWSRGLSRFNVTSPDIAVAVSAEDSPAEQSTEFPGSTAPGPELAVEDTAITVSEQVRAAYLLRGRVSSLSIESIYTLRDFRFQSEKNSASSLLFRSALERRVSSNTTVRIFYEHARDTAESNLREHRIGLTLRLSIR